MLKFRFEQSAKRQCVSVRGIRDLRITSSAKLANFHILQLSQLFASISTKATSTISLNLNVLCALRKSFKRPGVRQKSKTVNSNCGEYYLVT